MTKKDIIDSFEEEELLFVDGFESAIIGIDTVTYRVVYNKEIMIEVLIAEGMSYEDALEHFSYNIEGAYVGEKTPIYCQTTLL
jgi:hypothetical protein